MNLYLQFLLFTFAGWVNRHQQAVIEYLQAENQALREQLGNKRIRWTDVQRRRLAEKAKAVGRIASSSRLRPRPTQGKASCDGVSVGGLAQLLLQDRSLICGRSSYCTLRGA